MDGTAHLFEHLIYREVEGAKASFARLRLVSPVEAPLNSSIYQGVDEAYEERFREPLSFYDANIYDACWIMALSIIEVNYTDGEAVRRLLLEVALRYTGASGNCQLDEFGDREACDYALLGYRLIDGEYKETRVGHHHEEDKVI
jgi:ABC-type branched-subunit amino acid transport system substrate-binding protein